METFDIIGDIRDRFQVFDDPMDKYAYLIELGKKSNGLSDSEKIDRNKIHGCASDSWIIIERNTNQTYSIRTDSEAFIVRGLLNLLEMAVNNRTPIELENMLSESFLDSIGLAETISSQRTNGFMNAIKIVNSRIKDDR